MDHRQQAALGHFRSVSWCARILEDPKYELTHAESRKPKLSGEDSLFAETLQTGSTIPHCLFLIRRPADSASRIEEVLMLVQLEKKLNGHPTTAHGGLQAFLLDEAMAKLMSVNKDLMSQIGDPDRPTTVTKSLNVEFVRPVTTPCPVLVSARFKEGPNRSSRKSVIYTELRAGGGEVLTKGEGLFVKLKTAARAKM